MNQLEITQLICKSLVLGFEYSQKKNMEIMRQVEACHGRINLLEKAVSKLATIAQDKGYADADDLAPVFQITQAGIGDIFTESMSQRISSADQEEAAIEEMKMKLDALAKSDFLDE